MCKSTEFLNDDSDIKPYKQQSVTVPYLCCERVTVIVGSKYQHATVAAYKYKAQCPHNEQPQRTESKWKKLDLVLSGGSIKQIKNIETSGLGK